MAISNNPSESPELTDASRTIIREFISVKREVELADVVRVLVAEGVTNDQIEAMVDQAGVNRLNGFAPLCEELGLSEISADDALRALQTIEGVLNKPDEFSEDVRDGSVMAAALARSIQARMVKAGGKDV